ERDEHHRWMQRQRRERADRGAVRPVTVERGDHRDGRAHARHHVAEEIGEVVGGGETSSHGGIHLAVRRVRCGGARTPGRRHDGDHALTGTFAVIFFSSGTTFSPNSCADLKAWSIGRPPNANAALAEKSPASSRRAAYFSTICSGVP